ncbi:MAG: NAD(P)/FAD-dependent oxidoreductase [Burkholderiaceae bacterium]|jgi:thioredoxin reductase (NADPH)|nr:NAD(P)/FAD-dependent oxidoreductase [Burkholderiaceae bacterium]
MERENQQTSIPSALIETDAAIIGAGPVGLFQVFALGLLEIQAHVIDALPHVGGQPAALYAGKPIYDIPAIPECSGRALIERLMRQAAPFAPRFHLGRQVQTLQRQPDGRWLLGADDGLALLARVVVIAAGVGAFQPKRLRVAGIDAFERRQLFYGVDDPARFVSRRLVITGGGDSALDWAIHFAALAEYAPASITLLHRRNGFTAADASVARLRALCDANRLRFMVGQISGFEQSDGKLTALQVTSPDGINTPLAVDTLLVFHGLTPRLGPIADWQLALERKQLAVDTEKFQTNQPGIFAVGDINTYPGKQKLILCGFHEATLAAHAARAIIAPEQEGRLQYSTGDARLQRLIGGGH